MEELAQLVYQMATAMLAPALVVLVLLYGWSLFTLGSFLGEWRSRRQLADAWQRFVTEGRHTVPRGDTPAFNGLQRDFAAAIQRGSDPEKTLAGLEVNASGRLAWMSFGVRTGPLLGLMGTLIPMGPALVGLSAGDIEAMAGNLVIVFSTTVVGVFIGGLSYTMLLVRRQWYARDLVDIEFALRRPMVRKEDDSAYACEEERCA
jgi:biopolymer transport protein ExbB/TolQ